MNARDRHLGSAAARSAASTTVRVFIAEDHRITMWGLQHLVDGCSPHMQVIGTAASRAELLAHDALPLADIVILDLDLGGEHSGGSIADIQRRSHGHVLVLTGNDDPDEHRAVMMQGARGVLHKGEPAVTILRAIEKVHDGEVWLDRTLLAQVLGTLTCGGPAQPRHADPHQQRIATLTTRERQIVGAVVRMAGKKQLTIAGELGLSENTLRNHLTTIYSKLGLHGRLELHLYAVEHGVAAAPRQEAA